MSLQFRALMAASVTIVQVQLCSLSAGEQSLTVFKVKYEYTNSNVSNSNSNYSSECTNIGEELVHIIMLLYRCFFFIHQGAALFSVK